jgi:hypothetical protein
MAEAPHRSIPGSSGQMFFSQLNQFDVSIFHDATSFFPP